MPSGVFSLKQQVAAIRQGAWTNQPPTTLNYFVVAGGGAGGDNADSANGNGGGGAGGLLQGSILITAGTSYTVTVGAGSGRFDAQGSASVFGSISATGGGSGARHNNNVSYSGGSGGGGSSGSSFLNGSFGIFGQGNAGGTGSSTNTGGGGGGAGTVGLNGSSSVAGSGGSGIASDISGIRTIYAGGGGGGAKVGATQGLGGVGGGGAGNGTSGTANTGGGGGGSSNGSLGGNGGSGIVIVSYPGTTQWFTGGTVYYANGNVVHVFTSSGTLAPTTATPANSSYTISRSLRFNSADSAYLSRTPASASNRQTWTISMWVKRGDLSAATRGLFGAGSASATDTGIYWTSGDKIDFFDRSGGTLQGYITTTAVFRDPSAWYHLVFVFDSTNATAANRMLIYVNNVLQGVTVNNTLPQNTNSSVNNTVGQNLGSLASASNFGNGYMTEVNFIDGQALTPSSFGETSNFTGVWVPKAYTGTYGTNGFYVNFSDNSNTTAATLGKDYSGNGNNWTPNNFSVTAGTGNDSLVDSPTAYGFDTGVGGTVRGNYATWNSLVVNKPVLTNGNLDADGSDLKTAISTMGVSSGKWYWEISIGSGTNTPNMGVTSYANDNADPGVYLGTGRSYVSGGGGGVYKNYTATSTGANTNFSDGNTAGAVIGFALDCDAGTLAYYVNNVLRQTDSTIATGTLLYPMTCNFNSTTNAYRNTSVNFGQRPFAYTAPSGYKALCTQNLLTPAVVQGDDYFNTVLWTGTGATQSITGVGFETDFVWIKCRSVGYSHNLLDRLRGITNARLFSNLTDAENTGTTYINSTNSDGFQLAVGDNGSNGTGATYVAWNWKANGSGSTNTAGSITSTVSANTTSGFSVVTYTGNGSSGATVGHGLGATPAFVIIKNRGAVSDWRVWTTSFGTGNALTLNDTSATSSNSAVMQATPTSSLIYLLGTGYGVNNSGNTYVAYCFAAIPGFSAFGSYTGNGSSDGPFVYAGFRPAWILVKRSSSSGEGWWIYDNKRSPYNIANVILSPDSSGAEISGGTYPIDINSNGFKIRGINALLNTSAATYIYAAFAENPFKYALAR